MSCEHCRKFIYSTEAGISEKGMNHKRHAILLQCSHCFTFYETVGEEKGVNEVGINFVKKFYPDVLKGKPNE